jgi:hypothetical protein
MSLITGKPGDLVPTPNDLDSIPDDLLGPHPANIRMSGKDLLVMDAPPDIGEFVKMEITMRCKDDGRTLLADGGIGHYRVMSFVAAKVTTDPYKPEPESGDDGQPGLLDANGQIPDDDEGGHGQDDGLDEFDPEFSHNGRVE